VGQKIERDNQRFRKLVRGKVKSNLSKYISRGEMIGKKGKDLVSIPLPQIEIPQFRYGNKNSGGTGSGDGDVGQPLGPPQGQGKGGAGDQPGGHILEVELTMEEMAQILGEELELPRIQPRGKKNIVSTHDKYTGIRQTGPESLRHFKRTFKRALKRQISAGIYNPKEPIVIPVREDKQYRSWKEVRQPQAVAAIIYMMDVSGSMTDEQKEIVRIEAFWIDTWIKAHYQGVETAYIIHDAAAQEVDEHTFYHTRESGGTKISSAYELCEKVIAKARTVAAHQHADHRAGTASSTLGPRPGVEATTSRPPASRARSSGRLSPTWPSRRRPAMSSGENPLPSSVTTSWTPPRPRMPPISGRPSRPAPKAPMSPSPAAAGRRGRCRSRPIPDRERGRCSLQGSLWDSSFSWPESSRSSH